MGNLLDALQPYVEDDQLTVDDQFDRFHKMSTDDIKSAILNDDPERSHLECFIHIEGSAVLYQWLEDYYANGK